MDRKEQDQGRSLPATSPSDLSPVGSSQSGIANAGALPDANALVLLMVDWGSIPAAKFHERYPFYKHMEARAELAYGPLRGNEAAAYVFAELAESLEAQAIETRSAVGATDAPISQESDRL